MSFSFCMCQFSLLSDDDSRLPVDHLWSPSPEELLALISWEGGREGGREGERERERERARERAWVLMVASQHTKETQRAIHGVPEWTHSFTLTE